MTTVGDVTGRDLEELDKRAEWLRLGIQGILWEVQEGGTTLTVEKVLHVLSLADEVVDGVRRLGAPPGQGQPVPATPAPGGGSGLRVVK